MQVINLLGACLPGSQGSKGAKAQGVVETKQKLDPISILAKCALMKFKEEGSRITYEDLSVFIQQPSKYTILSIQYLSRVRELKRQSCKDTEIIEIAINKAAAWHQPHAEGNEIYKTLFEKASEGLESLIETYKKKQDYALTVSGLNGWKDLITKVTTEGLAKASDLDVKAEKVKTLWDRLDIIKINNLIEQMNTKQDGIPISQGVKCLGEIKQLEFLLDQKHGKLKKIWGM